MAPAEVSAELMAILRCPRCRGTLQAQQGLLACAACQLGFPVQDGVPNFLIEDAQPLAKKGAAR